MSSKKVAYIDITKESIKNIANKRVIVTKAKYYVDDLFNKYYVDNKTVVFNYNKKEIEVATWLAKTFNEKVYMLSRINIPKGIKTADYLFKNEKMGSKRNKFQW